MKLCMGKNHHQFDCYIKGTASVHHVEDELLNRDQIIKLLKANLEVAWELMKIEATNIGWNVNSKWEI